MIMPVPIVPGVVDVSHLVVPITHVPQPEPLQGTPVLQLDVTFQCPPEHVIILPVPVVDSVSHLVAPSTQEPHEFPLHEAAPPHTE